MSWYRRVMADMRLGTSEMGRLIVSAVFACFLRTQLAEGQQGATLSGRVTDRSTGKGVRNAEIILFGL